jgi:hypothetical protein
MPLSTPEQFDRLYEEMEIVESRLAPYRQAIKALNTICRREDEVISAIRGLLSDLIERERVKLDPLFSEHLEELNDYVRRGYVPYKRRFSNLQMTDAIQRFIREESPDGASEPEILEGLRSGGRHLNVTNFPKQVRAALTSGVRFRLLLRVADLYKIGPVRPAGTRRNKNDIGLRESTDNN